MNDAIVNIHHVRAHKLCIRGVRLWFKNHNLDFQHFLKHGYPAAQIESTGDHFALQVVQTARAELRKD